MTVIEGSTVKCSTLVDGTLRIVIDIEPGAVQEAFKLFGVPGRAVALAALADGRCALVTAPVPRTLSQDKAEAASARWHAKGPLERAAISLCSVQDFQDFVGVTTAKEAGEKIKEWCGIDTRKVLDTDHEAADAFRMLFLDPYNKHLAGRGAHV